MRFCFGLMLWWLSGSLCGQIYLSRIQVEKNVQAIRMMLLSMHPAADQYCGRDSLEKALSGLLEMTPDSIYRDDFEFRVRKLLRRVGCGHTNIYTQARKKSARKKTASGKASQQVIKILPFKIFANDTAVWMLASLDSLQPAIPAGGQLLFFNEKPARAVVEHLRQHQVPDGFVATTGLRVLNLNLYFNYLHRKYFPADTLCQLIWRHPVQGFTDTVYWRAIPADSVEKRYATWRTTRDTMSALFSVKDRFFYFHPKQPQTAVLRIAAFSGIRLRFYRRIFREMKRRQTQKLIIDLRDNLGGNYYDCKILMRALAEQPARVTISRRTFRSWRHLGFWGGVNRVVAFLGKDVFSLMPRCYGWRTVRYFDRIRPMRQSRRFSGVVVLLVNGLSASAGAHLPAHVRQCATHVAVVGEETGGGARTLNAMQIQRLHLPHGGFLFDVPQYHVDFGLGKDTGRGVLPDVQVNYTVDDILQQRDLEMERALEIDGSFFLRRNGKRFSTEPVRQ